MHIRSSVGTVLGSQTNTHWAQTIKTPSAYGVIEIEDDAGIAQTIGMRALAKLTSRLNEPVVSLRMLEGIADEVFGTGMTSLVLLVPVGVIVYIVIRGEGVLYLKRNGQYATLLDHEGSMSGKAEEKDVLLLMTKACGLALTEEEALGVFDHLPVSDVTERLTDVLQGKAQNGGCATLVYEATSYEEEEDAQITEDVPNPKKGFFAHVRRFTQGERVRRFVRYSRDDKRASIRRNFARMFRVFKNPNVAVTAALIALFVGFVVYGAGRELFARRDEELVRLIHEAQYRYDEGVALMDLNPIKGRERLVDAKGILEPVKASITDRTKDGRKALELYDQIQNAITQAMNAYAVEPTIYYDAALLKSDGYIQSFVIANDMLVLGDAQQRAVYTLTIPSKTGQIVAGGNGFEGIRAVALHGTMGYVFTPEGIHSVALQDKVTKQKRIEKNDEWGTIQAMVSFGGNLYLLDTAKSRIWKYVATESGFSDMREYLNPDTLPDLSQTTSMAIDGSVWLGTKKGTIMRFTQGKENTFVAKGIDPPLSGPVVVYTDDNAKNIYALETTGKRVVVVDKEGIYISQYTWTGAMSASNLVVSEKQGKILLQSDGRLYSIDLK